jgi:flagellar basal-body rod modification protein FlgD
MTTAVSPSAVTNPYAALLDQPSTAAEPDASVASADRFLTMLVTQLQNQDPLNPMDNAQITSQMAQINAVTGLEKVNASVQSLGGQFLQMQAMQGAALVGREVAFEGDSVTVTDGVGRGGVELAGNTSSTRVEVLDGAGRVVGSVDMGPQEAGRHTFEWPVGSQPANGGYRFRVTATLGNAAVDYRPMALDRVTSVSTAGDTLSLSTAHSGVVPASQILSYN